MTDRARGPLAHDDKVTVSWVCRRLDLNKKTVYKLIAAGELDAFDIPNVGWRIAFGSVIAFEERCRSKSA